MSSVFQCLFAGQVLQVIDREVSRRHRLAIVSVLQKNEHSVVGLGVDLRRLSQP